MAQSNTDTNTQNNQNKDTHQDSNTHDHRVNVTDNPDKQQPEADNPASQRRSRTPSEEANVPNDNNQSHGNRPKVSRQSSEDHD